MSDTPRVDNYRFGSIRIDGETYTKDVIILPDRVIREWWREHGHSLVMDDLQEVLDAGVDVLVVGIGQLGRVAVPQATVQQLREAGLDVIIERTGSACDTYNEQRDQRRVAAALHLTC